MLASPSKRATKPKVSFSIISAKYTLWLLCLSVLLISVECSSGSNDGANGLQSSSSTPTNQQQANNNKPQQPQAAQDNKPFYEPPKRQSTDDEYLIGVGLADITGPAADINLVSLIQQLASSSGLVSDSNGVAATSSSSSVVSSGTGILDGLIRLQHPSWRELSDIKLQLKINFNPLLLRYPFMDTLFRWAMPNQLKMQAEYTYANLVVQL